LRRSGITAPCVSDGAINGERFHAYIEQMLAPTLRPNDVVLLDSLSSRKAAGVVEAITAQGARLVYLPPYSPDLNPIEQAFAKFKAARRCAGRQNAPATVCGRRLAVSLNATNRGSAESFSKTPVTQSDRKPV
jgi:transposase